MINKNNIVNPLSKRQIILKQNEINSKIDKVAKNVQIDNIDFKERFKENSKKFSIYSK